MACRILIPCIGSLESYPLDPQGSPLVTIKPGRPEWESDGFLGLSSGLGWESALFPSGSQVSWDHTLRRTGLVSAGTGSSLTLFYPTNPLWPSRPPMYWRCSLIYIIMNSVWLESVSFFLHMWDSILPADVLQFRFNMICMYDMITYIIPSFFSTAL